MSQPIRRLFAAVFAMVAGCNILNGASTLDIDSAEVPPSPDAYVDPEAAVLPPLLDAATDRPAADATPDSKADVDAARQLRVFLSSTKRDGRFGNLAVADVICGDLAKNAGRAGKWVAWLSNKNGIDAIDRLTSQGPWYLVTGELVASGKAQLASGSLAHAIDRDQQGTTVPPADGAWTGTNPNGLFSGLDCNAWGPGTQADVGDGTFSDSRWTSFVKDACDTLHRFYCFEL